ncbi:hypothetical protein IFR05_006001 [Cadophora sp. M221]|nr:hypothetical protein IFR05_006001 [Cadophora sp. M221]
MRFQTIIVAAMATIAQFATAAPVASPEVSNEAIAARTNRGGQLYGGAYVKRDEDIVARTNRGGQLYGGAYV